MTRISLIAIAIATCSTAAFGQCRSAQHRTWHAPQQRVVYYTVHQSPATTCQTVVQRNIVDTASAAGSFKTLLAAARAAGLVETLTSPGPFTVLAPTDAAFAKLPKGTVEDLLRPENKNRLRAILAYHVIPGAIRSDKIVTLSEAPTVQGQPLSIRTVNGRVQVNGAHVTKTDITCSNGVIHVIDSVLLPSERKDIVDTAASAGSFKTLLAAATAAGLVETLKSDGPLTVLAPTDDAFAALPAGTVEDLLKPENRDQLKAVLTYHVIPGRVTADQISKISSAITVQGQPVAVKTTEGRVQVNGANVVKADIECSNGVIHVIDRVLLPSRDTANRDLVETAAAAGSFKTLVAAVKAAGLEKTLKGKGPFTIFAPTDEAFAKLPAGTVESLLKPENRDQLVAILTYHVVPGAITAENASKLRSAKTVNGKPLTLNATGGGLNVGGAKVTATDIRASNGVIHVIDSVLIPE